jgi:biopolymer transport protein ExbD
MLLKRSDVAGDIHIDFVPMVDVLFNLLVFFLLATSLKIAEREMQVALPFTRAAGPISAAMRELVINVGPDGQIIVGGKPMDPADLAAMVKSAVSANPDQKVSVRGDRTTAYANIVRVLDICKASGAQQPYLDTIHAQ